MRLIDIKNLTFEYFRRDADGNAEEMLEALKEVSFDVKAGEFVAIVGRNGSGKSTLAKHINALLLPGEGQIIVDGMDTAEEELHLQIRKTAGMVFQNPDNQIVSNLVEEDIAFGPENLGVPTEKIWNRVKDALCTTGMEKYRGSSPNQLSGGQKQRVAIAGVLAMEPKCILFDEATAMLDPQARKQLLHVAKQLQQEKGITILFITHHMDEVMYADRVIVMNGGHVMEQGTPKEIFEKKALLDDCGLQLPVMYQYIHFLMEQNLISQDEVKGILDETDLKDLLCEKMKQKKAIRKKTKDIKKNDVETDDIETNDLKAQNFKCEDNGNTDRKNKAKDKKNTEIEGKEITNQDRKGIVLKNVSHIYNKGYVTETAALKDVNLEIGNGEFIAVIGTTGSGKSTLVQHLNGLYVPTEGTVCYNGQDIAEKDFSIKTLRQKVGFVFQNPEYQLFAETVEKDVSFGPENMNITKEEAQKRVYEAIRAVGLPDTIYDASPLQLSGGQKRRVAIAGVLAMQPEYLVLDEPTAGLDPIAATELLDMLKELQVKKNITIVIVSHNLEEVAEYAERVIVMKDGQKIMDDSSGEVFRHVPELEQAGLSVPLGVRILYALKLEGLDVDLTKCRQKDVCKELLKWKNLF